MTKTLEHIIWSVSTQRELSNNKYQQEKGLDGFKKSLPPCDLGKSSLSIWRIKSIALLDVLVIRNFYVETQMIIKVSVELFNSELQCAVHSIS